MNELRLSVDVVANRNGGAPNADGEWVAVAGVGRWRGHPAGPYTLTPAHLRSIEAYFDRHYSVNGTDLVVDYEHQSMVPAREAPAAGWIDHLRVIAGGILEAHVRWNQRAEDFMNQREYRYLSPVFRFNRPDRVTGEKVLAMLDSVALTNKPFLTELPAVVNTSGDDAGIDQPNAAREQEEGKMEDLLKLLAAAWSSSTVEAAAILGIAEDAEDKAVFEALASKAKAVVANSAAETRLASVANSLGVAADADETIFAAKVLALKAPNASLGVVANALGLPPTSEPASMVEEINRLKGVTEDHEAEQLVANAITEKKITPADKDWWLGAAKQNLKATETVINSMAPVIDDETRDGNPPGTRPVLDDGEKRVCSLMGVTEEEFVAAKAG